MIPLPHTLQTMPGECLLFAAQRTIDLGERLLQPSVIRCDHTWQGRSVSSLDEADRMISDTFPDRPFYADRPPTSLFRTHIYVVHLMRERFAFAVEGRPFTA